MRSSLVRPRMTTGRSRKALGPGGSAVSLDQIGIGRRVQDLLREAGRTENFFEKLEPKLERRV